MLKRFALFVGVLAVAACSGGPGAPTPPEPSPGPIPPYNRDEWQHWIDADSDCQDTRAEVLIRDSIAPVTFRPRPDGRSCVVDTGVWADAYGGQTFTQASDLDIDHVVPLAEAHRSGGWAWDAVRKRDYANDLMYPRHLLPVSASLNRSKGDRGPHLWLPPNAAFGCEYGQAWREIKARWMLVMTSEETAAVAGLLQRCGG